MPSARANLHAGLERRHLATARASTMPVVDELADQRRHAVVAQPAGVDRRRHEVVAEGVHLDQRRHLARVAEVVVVLAARQARRRRRLDGDDAVLALATQLTADEREGEPGEVGSAADAGDERRRAPRRPWPSARSPPGR